MATQTVPQGMLPVRETLRTKYGIADERIGWNPKTGYVTIDGRDILKPNVNIQGTTYANPDVFGSAQGAINQANKIYQLQERVLNPQQQYVNPIDERLSNVLDMLQNRIMNQRPIDLRDVYRSPQYEAMQAQAQRQAQQAIRGAQEALGGSGFARSTIVSDRAQAIQNQANEYLQTQVVPQIIAQMQAERDRQTAALMDLLGVLGQQQQLYDTRAQREFQQAFNILDYLTGRQDRAEDVEFREREFAYRQQQDALAQKNLEEEKAYRRQRDSEEDRRWWAQFEREGQQFAQRMGLEWAQLNQRQKEFLADQAWKEKYYQLDLQKAKQAAEQTGIDEYDLLTVKQMAEQQGINFGRATDDEIRNFVASMKTRYGWSTDEAKGVERYLNNLRTEAQRQRQAEAAQRQQKSRDFQREFFSIYTQNPYLNIQ